MKNKKIIIFGIIILYFTLYIASDIFWFERTYDTVEKALKCQRDVKVEKVVAVLEDKEYAVGLYRYGSTTASRYLKKTKKGWKVLDSNIWFYQHFRQINGYDISWYKNDAKYLIYIDKLSRNNEDILQPKDSINSEFKYFLEKDADTTISSWFLVLDELPKDYTITIGEKSFAIK